MSLRIENHSWRTKLFENNKIVSQLFEDGVLNFFENGKVLSQLLGGSVPNLFENGKILS